METCKLQWCWCFDQNVDFTCVGYDEKRIRHKLPSGDTRRLFVGALKGNQMCICSSDIRIFIHILHNSNNPVLVMYCIIVHYLLGFAFV